MSDKTHSQAQQGAEPFQSFSREQLDRVGALFQEWQKLEAQGVERAKTAVDEAANLFKTSLGYAVQLSEQWRKLALEAGRNAIDFTSFRG